MIKDILFASEEEVNPLYFAGRVILFIVILIFGLRYIFSPIDPEYFSESWMYFFLHYINLPFHEAGHIIFSFFGEFMTTLGGSLMQILIPLILLVIFLYRGNAYASSIMLWWTGQSFIDLAPYIDDARAQRLILIGGITGEDVPGIHDWNNILGAMGLLKHDHTIALISFFSGKTLIILSFIWGIIILYHQYKRLA
ncbi:MAG TPA: hypothetical protein PK864_07735 [Syntrophorhabdaceae bacterium]|nr:hypothetical protein [Syntrophorhabdaceae bacterium]HOL06103.1 hypothetical protein [Syntrophorhabdaceae bacterium]HON85906.1 hypothetical protein [Syntrophorhabdaceae bacterium]HOT42313.1 hypothetical protein [Syntrophorhabdaceae bacterium]HPC67433.1 hypothetical protein [Syntrophorhabdaceae bacterium]